MIGRVQNITHRRHLLLCSIVGAVGGCTDPMSGVRDGKLTGEESLLMLIILAAVLFGLHLATKPKD